MSEVIPHWLSKRALLSPDEVAIELPNDETITFLQLKQQSETFARQLATLGVKKGDKIAVYSTNNPDMIVAIHGISYLGGVVVLLNTRLTKSEITYQIMDAKVQLILVNDDLLTEITNMDLPVKMKSFSQVAKELESKIHLVTELRLDKPFTIVYTSGTTGSPKGVVHTYGNHWWSAIGSALNLGLSSNDKWLTVLPLFHVGGFSICIRSIIYGIPMYLLQKFNSTEINYAILNNEVTIASVVTVMLQRLNEQLGEREYPKSFRCMLLGGGPVPKPLLEDVASKNIPVFQSYGLTETSSQIVTLSPQDALYKLGSAGKPLFPGQLKINDPDDEGVGEIFVKGPMVTKGYYNNKKANKEAFKNNWLATGDLGYVDNDGFLYVVERRTDLIISGGENVYPSEIESVISGIKSVKEVGVVGKPNVKWGEVPVAFVVKTKENLTEEAIIQHARKYLASYKVPVEVCFLEELPRTASNKLMRSELKHENC